jgi:hypothetical protein
VRCDEEEGKVGEPSPARDFWLAIIDAESFYLLFLSRLISSGQKIDFCKRGPGGQGWRWQNVIGFALMVEGKWRRE